MALGIEFLGGAGTVTGSRTLLRHGNNKALIDCGLFQGPKALRMRNWEGLGVPHAQIDAVVLTHAHLDHSGYLPRLAALGYAGPVFCSQGTFDLCKILLLDAARLQEEDAGYANKTGHSHHKPALPLYTVGDAEKALGLFRPLERDTWHPLFKNLDLRLIRSGHIVGSSFVQLSENSGGQTKTLTFSGDLGHGRSHTLKGPAQIRESDFLVLESTYGDRLHSKTDILDSFAEVTNRTISRGGVLVIPSFAVGRTQEVVFLLRLMEDRGLIPKVPVLLDSPMAQAATKVFMEHKEDQKIDNSFSGPDDNFFPAMFETIDSPDDSMMACMREGPLVVIAGAGMLSGGRVLHHLKTRLPQARNTVLFVGYQAEGSKGRFLLDQGATTKRIRIHHQEIEIEAELASVEGLSAHADYSESLKWLRNFQKPPRMIFVNHGSVDSATALATKIQTELKIESLVAKEGDRKALWS